MKIATPALILLVVLLSCDRGSASAPSLVVSIDRSGPFPIVRSAGRAPTWKAELAYTVGSDSSGPAEFGSISRAVPSRCSVMTPQGPCSCSTREAC